MNATIDLRLFASLADRAPADAHHYPIVAGITIAELLEKIQVPLHIARIIFVDGVRSELDRRLNGGERVGIFPPIGGG